MNKQICAVCGDQYQHGNGIYEGHRLELYADTFCCDVCWKGNQDGWGPIPEPRVLEICEENSIEVPKRNSRGWLPIE